MNARDVVCPACNAQAGEPCTSPNDTGRRDVKWDHMSRMERSEERSPVDQFAREKEHCVDYGRHFPESRHTRASCPALLPFESVAEPGSVDMSEEFQRQAEVREEAATVAYDLETAYIPSSLQSGEIRAALRAAFVLGAEWGSRPF
jgi:hypothetical protein